MKRKLMTGILCLSVIVTSAVGVKAKDVTFMSHYGEVVGSCRTYTWSQPSSPKYRRIDATTTNSGKAPKIAAEVYGKKGGKVVMSAKKTAKVTDTVTATDNSTAYVNATLSLVGQHAVWSDNVARVDYTSSN